MNHYIEVKIKKKTLRIWGIIIVLLCSLTGYYFWCSYHPNIVIEVNASSINDDLKIEAPHVAYTTKHDIAVAASVELKIIQLWIQHEYVCQYVKEHYKTADIKLKLTTKENQTILYYQGSVTTLKDEKEEYKKEIILDFVLDAVYK